MGVRLLHHLVTLPVLVCDRVLHLTFYRVPLQILQVLMLPLLILRDLHAVILVKMLFLFLFPQVKMGRSDVEVENEECSDSPPEPGRDRHDAE